MIGKLVLLGGIDHGRRRSGRVDWRVLLRRIGRRLRILGHYGDATEGMGMKMVVSCRKQSRLVMLRQGGDGSRGGQLGSVMAVADGDEGGGGANATRSIEKEGR